MAFIHSMSFIILPRLKQLPKTEGVSAHRSVVGKRTKFEIESLEILQKRQFAFISKNGEKWQGNWSNPKKGHKRGKNGKKKKWQKVQKW